MNNLLKITISLLILSTYPLYANNGWSIVDSNKWKWEYVSAKQFDKLNILATAKYRTSKFNISEDGGLNWNQLYLDSIFKKDNYVLLTHTIAYYDIKNIIFACELGDFIITEDSGKTWQYSSIGKKETIRYVQFISNDTGLVMTSLNLYLTLDGAKTWKKLEIFNLPAEFKRHWNMSFPNKNLIILNSDLQDDNDNIFLISNDFGVNWKVVKNPALPTSFLYFLNEKTGWLYTNYSGLSSKFHDVIMKTSDGGLTWQEQLDTLNEGMSLFFDMNFFDMDNGFICGSDGKIYKTTNSGSDWILINPYPKKGYEPHFSRVLMLSKSTCLVFTNNGEILKYDESLVDVDDNSIKNEVDIFPTPATDKLFINSTKKFLYSIQLFSLLGEKVYENNFIDEVGQPSPVVLEIDISTWSPGIYFARIEAAGKIWTEKIIKIGN